MKTLKNTNTLLLLLTLLLSSQNASSDQLIVEESSGNHHLIEYNPSDSFLDVMHSIKKSLKQSTESSFHITEKRSKFNNQSFSIRALKISPRNTPRNFYLEVNENEKQDIRYLLEILANASLFSISNSKSSLQKVADNLDHLHPLQILSVICNDQELLRYLHKIRKRSWVWSDLFDKYCDSLNQESNYQNILPHANAFGESVNLDAIYFMTALQQRNWNEFFDILFATHPIP